MPKLIPFLDMEAESTTGTTRSPETSLSESWNVVDAQEVNNGSEGSDGESIEVIEEESQSTEPQTDKVSTESNAEPLGNERIEVLSIAHEEMTEGSNIYLVCAFIALLVAVLLGSAVFSLFLLKFEEFALDQLKFFTSSFTSSERSNEYEELLEQIKTYKSESQDLKGIVSELNAAVLSLKNDLAFKTSGNLAEDISKESMNVEDKLFEQLLSIHSGNFLGVNDSERLPEQYKHSFKVIEDILNLSKDRIDNTKNMETIKQFYLIPKLLSVLSTQYSADDNVKQFIDFWNEKLSILNDNLINDLKEIQLKMISHTLKHFKNTEKFFFKKLCDLKNFNRPECYNTFIKPYEYTAIPLVEEKLDEKLSYYLNVNEKGKNVGNGLDHAQSCSFKRKQSLNKKERDCIQKDSKNNQFAHYVENKQVTTDTKEDGVSIDEATSGKKKYANKNLDKQSVKTKPQPSLPKKANNPRNKGMENDVLPIETNKAEGKAINSFSSFSSGCTEGRCPRKWREGERLKEGWWFLRLGHQRSRMRHAQTRGDWLFERARFRRRRNSFLREPFFTKPPQNTEEYSYDFLRSQGFI